MNRRLPVLALALSLTIPLSAQSGTKVPVTTSSAEALDSYLKGRDLSEKLRGQEARAHFDRAIELDADFAMAYLSGSVTQATGREFFEYLETAATKTDKASEVRSERARKESAS